MNRRWMIVGVAIVALALLAGGVSYRCFQRAIPTAADTPEHDALAWVRQEFGLAGEKLARVEAMHAAYATVCEEHCRAIARSRNELRRARSSGASPAEIATAEAKAAEVDALCIRSTETHVREIAEVIGGAEGERYLALVLPRVKAFDHSAPATLDMNTAAHAHDHAVGE